MSAFEAARLLKVEKCKPLVRKSLDLNQKAKLRGRPHGSDIAAGKSFPRARDVATDAPVPYIPPHPAPDPADVIAPPTRDF
jgi:hypothetical protein